MRCLDLDEVLEIHRLIIEQSGGLQGIRDFGALESALVHPRMTFDGEELYPTLVDKAAVLGFTLIKSHPFVDGNKRIGHATMEVFLYLNGHEIEATVDEQEEVVLQVASGHLDREAFTNWLFAHTVKQQNNST